MNAAGTYAERDQQLARRNAFHPRRPQSFFIEQEHSASGEVVSVVTIVLTNRECPWRCIFCDLWKNTLARSVPPGAIPAQIDFAFRRLRETYDIPTEQSAILDMPPSHRARQIKLYNSGSFFDPKAIPPEDLPAIAERVRRFERIIVECHPALIGDSALRFRDMLAGGASPLNAVSKLEIAMGLEIADDALLARLNKGMKLEMYARASRFLNAHDVDVRAFVMVRPPFVTSEESALQFARRSIDFAFDWGASAVSLIPARFGAAELQVLAKEGHFAPPKLATLEAALDYGVGLRRGRVFADVWDLEKFAYCLGCFVERRERLGRVNLQQHVLPRIECRVCDVEPLEPGQIVVER